MADGLDGSTLNSRSRRRAGARASVTAVENPFVSGKKCKRGKPLPAMNGGATA